VVERELVLRLPEEVRADPRVLVALPIATPGGEMIQLGQVARLVETTGPNQILHEDGQRRIAISANTAGRDPASVVADIRAALEGMGPLPPGTSAHVGGTFESQERATRTIALLSLLSLAGMVGVLYSHLRSVQLTAQVLVNIPLALIGAVAALWLTGQPLSVASLVGFITLCGIATRNTILMISHYAHLVAFEGEEMGPAMVIRGSLERLVPVAMTALCAGIGLVPLALATGEPGKELLAPMAAVILGGLCSSTLLDMVLTPTVFLRWGGPALAPLVHSLRSPS
jgi:Cu/Ag efflux pump CusA